MEVIIMNKSDNDTFQKNVDQFLIQHRSILDVMTKYQESNARVNRAIAKAVTQCGCLKINAKKQIIPSNTKLTEIHKFMDNHLEGSLCDSCKEIIETEMGSSLFYVAAICSILNLDFNDIIKKEEERISTLGIYNLT
ncbi:MAG: DUF1573 domain-containing protein [bacterium]|uniref:DUF1573 domain-containing protein n=4 Tax=Candidatus Infernicultor aquiphilus TaxID=1805029 RepID=A0A2M7K6K0_9BACT|nr:DUF1573 domain-containing protein [bacterium]PIU25949.1 MAG: DUF1573 domain-containing protein [Candidatus Atribacteria bacterium CG08_land_8_20_14_0_20_33_29]PIW11205.1 MAG: DUF1573 domain-containing protein [Candidatus Atribacteria bacterium CG17_big_fil_post_rev_8_21_14_2_50_34_11]PIX33759.1 MAG: DUF1573 domain-containing protein [Candidatus Atribacteria bacterium CG_4_8_14_3_um_filter_34_18]